MEVFVEQHESKGSPASAAGGLFALGAGLLGTVLLVMFFPSMWTKALGPGLNLIDRAFQVAFLLLLPLAILSFFWLAWSNYDKRQASARLRRDGLTAKARIIAHEQKEVEDRPDEYYIYYQFRPEFKIQHQDATPDRRFFSLPDGAEIDVLYLKDKPHVSMPI
jgi:hypothetical protein